MPTSGQTLAPVVSRSRPGLVCGKFGAESHTAPIGSPMPDVVITSVEQATPEWLTTVLSTSDALSAGRVIAVDVDAGHGSWSSNARLRPHYSADAAGDCPASLFLKMVSIDLGDGEHFGDSEVAYYIRDYVDVPDAPLVRCHDAAHSTAEDAYHLLLDDVSATHIEATGRPPTLPYALALADGLAAMHARWWGADRLAVAGQPIHDAAHILHFVDIAAPGVPHVVDHGKIELAAHWPDLIQRLIAQHPAAMIDRTRRSTGFTIIHGDPGCANILVPREGDRPIYLIDRQPFDWSLTTWIGVYDLVYAAILDWPIADRRRLEQPLLQRYHDQLLGHGVAGYTWDQLWTDYRLMIPMGVYIAVEYCRGGLNAKSEGVWLPYLQRTLTACDDHDCVALW
jgi:hypothetical protein